MRVFFTHAQFGAFTFVDCYKCGIKFAMPQNLEQQRYQDRRVFCCPNGHHQVYCKPELDEKDREIRDLKLKLLHEQEQNEARRPEGKAEQASATPTKPDETFSRRRVQCPQCKKSYAFRDRAEDHLVKAHAVARDVAAKLIDAVLAERSIANA